MWILFRTSVIMAILKALPTELHDNPKCYYSLWICTAGNAVSLSALVVEISRHGNILVPHNRVTVMNDHVARHFCRSLWRTPWHTKMSIIDVDRANEIAIELRAVALPQVIVVWTLTWEIDRRTHVARWKFQLICVKISYPFGIIILDRNHTYRPFCTFLFARLHELMCRWSIHIRFVPISFFHGVHCYTIITAFVLIIVYSLHAREF